MDASSTGTPKGTPKARPLLRFANRVYTSTPQSGSKRFGTPLKSSFTPSTSARKSLGRDGLPSSGLNQNSIDAARNIFRASSLSQSVHFEPSIPNSTPRMSFTPGSVTPASRVMRESTGTATPRTRMARAPSANLFTMRIPSPDPDLTGEALTDKLPSDFDGKGTLYADQYLGHLCPKTFDDDQKRQFFCILDLRRLKHAADEIFVQRGWKLNVMNFAKEFEKSRSLILLRYGLYEFKNVKPSQEVIRRWRAAHGVAEEDEPLTATPTKFVAKPSVGGAKRKAEDDLQVKDHALSTSSANKNKRRATESGVEEPQETLPASKTNKRKISTSEEPDENQPNKTQKTTSATKSLFEKIAKGSASPAPAALASSTKFTGLAPGKPATPSNPFDTALKPNPFAPASRSSNGDLVRSVLDGSIKTTSSNIFGYLSDASSAKNSGIDADGESETESEPETEVKEVAASSGTNTPTLFAAAAVGSSTIPKPSVFSNNQNPDSSASDEPRESTPGRSIFDRLTKGTDGQPLRVPGDAETQPTSLLNGKDDEATPEIAKPSFLKSAPVNKTWTPNSPIKFGGASTPSIAPATGAGSTPAFGSLFGTKPQVSSNIFGSRADEKTEAKTAEQPKQPATQKTVESDGSGGESDKENDSQLEAKSSLAPSSSLTDPAPKSTPAPSNMFAAQAAPPPEAEKKTTELGTAPTNTAAPAVNPPSTGFKFLGAQAPPPTSLFGTTAAAPLPSTGSVLQSSTLFGAKAATAAADTNGTKEDTSKAAPPTFKFSTTSSSEQTTNGAASIFGAKPSQPASSIFGSTTSSTTPSTLAPTSTSSVFSFGQAASAAPAKASEQPSSTVGAPTSNMFGSVTTQPSSLASAPAPAPTFKFGQPATTDAAKSGVTGSANTSSLFGSSNNAPLFGGSPMKQDSQASTKRGLGDEMQEDTLSPVKKPLFGGENTSSASTFSFGGSQPSSSFTFGGAAPATQPSQPSQNTTSIFGNASGGGGFTFTASGNQGFNNPFASSSAGNQTAPPPNPANLFNFSASSSAQPTNGGGSFVFGAGAPSTDPAPAQSNNMFAFSASGSRATTPSGSNKRRPGQKPGFGASRGTPGLAQQQPLFADPSNGSNPFAPQPSFNFTPATPQQGGTGFGINGTQAPSMFGNLQPPTDGGGTSTTGTNSPFNFGGTSSLATTPAAGTPEPNTEPDTAGANSGEPNDAEAKQEQINLTEGGPGEEDEKVLHEVRAKVLKFTPPQPADGDDKAKPANPWVTKGVGPLRLLQHKTSNAVRLLLRREPTGQVALNRAILPSMSYTADTKYVKLTTSTDDGAGLETWMIQVKTKELATELAAALEKHKSANKS